MYNILISWCQSFEGKKLLLLLAQPRKMIRILKSLLWNITSHYANDANSIYYTSIYVKGIRSFNQVTQILLWGLIKSIKDLLCAAQRAGREQYCTFPYSVRLYIHRSAHTKRTATKKKKNHHTSFIGLHKKIGGKNPGFSTDSRNSSSSHHRKLPPLKPAQNLERVQLPRAFSRTQGELERRFFFYYFYLIDGSSSSSSSLLATQQAFSCLKVVTVYILVSFFFSYFFDKFRT